MAIAGMTGPAGKVRTNGESHAKRINIQGSGDLRPARITGLAFHPGVREEDQTVFWGQHPGSSGIVTAYDAVQYTKPAANKWYSENWMVMVKDGDPDGIARDGKAKVWEVYFFSPTPEEKCQFMVIYNRGNVWPNVPTKNKGGDDGQSIYKKNKPPDFRVDSSEAYTVAARNGGSEFMDAHPDAQASVTLRCKADYNAVGEEMPAPKYKWIWDVSFSEPKIDSEILHLYVDGMNGDFISKELQKPPA